MDFEWHNYVSPFYAMNLHFSKRSHLPIPKVFGYSSKMNPLGVDTIEWILMEYMGVELLKTWNEFGYNKKARFACRSR
jgi:hypothetical protein